MIEVFSDKALDMALEVKLVDYERPRLVIDNSKVKPIFSKRAMTMRKRLEQVKQNHLARKPGLH